MPRLPDLSVVVPIHNEQQNIEPLIKEIKKALTGKMRFEMVFVDDGSKDKSPQILADMVRKHSNFRAITHKQCAGQSAALRTGIKHAHGIWVATLDGDGQNDPSDIPELWKMLKKNKNNPALLLAGHRVNRQDSISKKISSILANKIRQRLLKDNTPDTGCGLKLFNREFFLNIPYFDHFHRYWPALFIRQGGVVTSVPVHHRPRTRGTSKYGFFDRLGVGIFDLIGVIWLLQRGRLGKIPVPVEQRATKGKKRKK